MAYPDTGATAKTVAANAAFLTQPETRAAANGSIEISILPDPCVYDGRFVNNGWLQELPNPLNKVTWENVALISPKTAADMNINAGNDSEEYTGGAQGVAFWSTRAAISIRTS